MIEGTSKREPKKDVCHFAIVLKLLFQKWFPLEGIEQPQEDMRRKDTLRERFIKNKRPLNPTCISPKKEKQPKTRTTRRASLMPQSNDDEKRKTLQKRQRKGIL
jgi:hypothetical protein